MMTGCPHIFERPSVSTRGRPSAPPPGGYGTMILTVLVGQLVWASAAEPAAKAMNAAPTQIRKASRYIVNSAPLRYRVPLSTGGMLAWRIPVLQGQPTASAAIGNAP